VNRSGFRYDIGFSCKGPSLSSHRRPLHASLPHPGM
jgi:hypothetical protein